MAGQNGGVDPAPGGRRRLGGRYELVRPIARGGMAEVWEGQDTVLRRPVAVKVLQTHLATDPTFVERFRREAVVAARLGHPCIVATYDTGVDAGTAYIVMELVRGQTLRQLLTASAPLDAALAVGIAAQIADALAAAHLAGLVHRDVKPANVLLTDDGGGSLRVKVTDFGIAKAGAAAGVADLTATGMVVGTPKYLSPEQVEGRTDPDARSDLYALGVVLFEMLTGRPPFNGPTEMATALSHLRDPPPRVAALRPGVGVNLDDFVASLLAKAPADRPPTAVAVRQALELLGRQGVTVAVRPSDRWARAGSDRSLAGSGPAGAAGRPAGPPRVPPTEPRPPALSGPVGNGGWLHPDHPGAAPRTGDPTDRTNPGLLRSDTGRRDAGARAAGRQAGARTPPSAAAPTAAPAARTGGRHPRPGRRRRTVVAGGVAAVVLAAVAVGAVALGGGGTGGGRSTRRATPAGPGPAVRIVGATVWMDTTHATPDNPDETRFIYDGDPATSWSTVNYLGPHGPEFGNLYDGEGIAIELAGPSSVVDLAVSSPTDGWAASTYVASSRPATGAPVSSWGTPTASAAGIDGDHTFSLGGRRGRVVLLWLTNLGPAAHLSISEVTVR
jgi:hypothetical protein